MVLLFRIHLALGTQELRWIEHLPRKTTFLPVPSPPPATHPPQSSLPAQHNTSPVLIISVFMPVSTPLLPPLRALRVLKTGKKRTFH